GAHGLATKVAVARVTAGKAAAKLRQRVAGARKAQLGAAELSGLVVAHWRAEPGVVAPLARTGLVRPQWMDELLAGRREAPPTTAASPVNLLVAADSTRSPRRRRYARRTPAAPSRSTRADAHPSADDHPPAGD